MKSHLIIGAIGVSALLFGVARWNAQQARLAADELPALANVGARLQTQQNAAETRVRQAGQSRVERRSPPPNAAPSTPPGSAKEFLARHPPNLIKILRDNPTLQNLQLAARRSQFAVTYSPFYRSLNLSSTQIAEFERVMLDHEEQLEDLRLAGEDKGVPYADPAYRKLVTQVDGELHSAQRELLGDAGVLQLREYERLSPVREMVAAMAGAAAMAGVSLDAEQSEELALALAKASPEYRNGKLAIPTSIDWNLVHEQARTFLSESQLTFITTTEARGPRGMGGRFLMQLHAAVNTAGEKEARAATIR